MDLQKRLEKYFYQKPSIGRAAFIAPSATVVGNVELGQNSSVWYNAVLRADINSIRIGEATNLQDHVILHLSNDRGVTMGDFISVGHGAIIHACEIGNECLIGMRSTIMDGAKIGEQCIVGAHSLVLQNFQAPPGSLIFGSPARIVRELTSEERSSIKMWAEKYIEIALAHQRKFASL
jgi:carbonic anhydrase/acetyltransferase-like protein (isoleucine patch superfamily)